MFENVTYNVILQRMLDRIPSDIDKREGSIIYDALAPAAVELQIAYIQLDWLLEQAFADTANREYLIRRVRERGIEPYPATKAVLKCVTTPNTVNVAIGTRFSAITSGMNYRVIEKITAGEYKVECEVAGTEGNKVFGNIIPVSHIAGLESAKLEILLLPARDEEPTEALRNRYFESFKSLGFGGNRADYINKISAIAGVGAVRVRRVQNSIIKVFVLGADYEKASSELITKVETAVDPEPKGEGFGFVPIGHKVLVETPQEKAVSITARFTFAQGITFAGLKSQIEDKVKEYLLELRKSWQSDKDFYVRLVQIISRLLTIEGIIDVREVRINGSTENLTYSEQEIPVFGSISEV